MNERRTFMISCWIFIVERIIWVCVNEWICPVWNEVHTAPSTDFLKVMSTIQTFKSFWSWLRNGPPCIILLLNGSQVMNFLWDCSCLTEVLHLMEFRIPPYCLDTWNLLQVLHFRFSWLTWIRQYLCLCVMWSEKKDTQVTKQIIVLGAENMLVFFS